MSKYILTAAAQSDLVEIIEFIEEENPAAALRVLEKLHSAMKQLSEIPGMGHKRIDLGSKELRFWQVLNYLIIYDPKPQPLPIIRVLHSARDVRVLLELS